MATVDQFDQIASAVDRALEAKGVATNQWLDGSPVFAWIDMNGKKEIKGGREVQVTLEYQKNDGGGSYSGLDLLDTTPKDVLAHALFSWKQYAKPVAISEADILKCQGPREIVNLITTLTKNASESLRDDMASDIFGDGTGNSSKDILGLKALVSASGTLGGIDRAVRTWWQAQADTTTTVVDFSWMNTMINNIKGSSGGSKMDTGVCDLITTTQTLYESVESLILPYARVEGTGVGNLGYTSLMYKGTEITWDQYCTAGYMYFLSSKYMGMRIMPNRDFKMGEWRTPVNQDGRVRHVLWMGQMVATNCRRLGVATNKSA